MAAVVKHLPTKLVSLPSAHLLCSICHNLYQEPVISVQCGHTFCRECLIKRGDKNTSSCPIDNNQLSIQELVLNRALVGQVEELSIYCAHGLTWSQEKGEFVPDPTGCSKIIKLGNRNEHEDECSFRSMPCPVGGTTCGSLRCCDVDSHKLVCNYHNCPHKLKGCKYAGRLADINKHKETCGFRGLSSSEPNVKSGDTVQELLRRIEILEKEKVDMSKQLNQCLTLIGGLTEKYSNIRDEIDRMKRVHRSPSEPKSRPKSSSSFHRVPSSSSFSSTQPVVRMERWTMPFQFKCIGTLRGHSGSVFSLCLKGNILYSAGADSVIRTWHLDELRKGTRMIIKGHRDAITVMAASDEYVYSASRDMSIRSWNPDDGTQKCIVENAHENEMAAMVYNEDYVFTSSISEIKVWDASTLKHVHTISGLHHVVRALALNGTKDKLYSGSHNTIEIWDAMGKFNLIGKIDHKFGSVHSLAVNRQYIFAGTYNRNIQVYDAQTQMHSQSLSGHFGSVTSLVISRSGSFLFSASSDATIKVWNLETMLPIQTLIRHEAAVHSIALQGDLLLSGSEDNDVKVYMYYNL